MQHAIEIVPGGKCLLPLGIIAGPQLGLDGAADALECAGGHDALGRTADAHQHVHIGLLAGRVDGAGDVAVRDEADPSAG